LLPGFLGQVFIWISLLTLISSTYFYLRSLSGSPRKKLYDRLGGYLYLMHGVSLLAAVLALYYLIFNHYFEYSYVWQYSALDLPGRFLISCFWAGQEGSFLIWAILQAIIGFILIRKSGDWKPWVMMVFSLGQIFLISMVLGLEIGGFKIGGSPFTLLRNLPQNLDLDLFKEQNYMAMIIDGNGLNPLLENIWMIIHPPLLFLGYAVALVPFCYAMASLLRGQFHAWLRPAIPWTLAAALSLGIGILLGGRWAYESLTFGGFWAWDPVENASLVPWLFLVASLHLMLIAQKRFHSYATTYFFTFMGWVFVVYATYLTRSGVLGETSVHAFGDSGKALQMLLFNALFLLMPLALLLYRKKDFPKKEGDEVLSREFWMLIGSIVIILSAFQVTLTTSIPVINKVFGTGIAPPVDNVNFYNTWQLPFGLLVVLLIGMSQYLSYGRNETGPFLKKMAFTAGISLLLTIIIAFGVGISKTAHIFLMLFVIFAIVVSIDFIVHYIKKTTNIGSSITHAGFALFILGVLLAFSNSQIISRNTSGLNLGKEKENAENLVLIKGIAQPMGNYMVTYSSNEVKGRETFYKVDFTAKDGGDPSRVLFSVYPSVNHNKRMGNVYNPATRHSFTKDIYTYISFSEQSEESDTSGYKRSSVEPMKLYDTILFNRSYIILDSIRAVYKNEDPNNALFQARFRILSMKEGILHTVLTYRLEDGMLEQEEGDVKPLGLKLRFEGFSPDTQTIQIGVYEKKQDFIVIKAVIFPYMNVLWFGAIIMFSGLTFSIMRRNRKKLAVSTPPDPIIKM